jgi:hypothetical protein
MAFRFLYAGMITAVVGIGLFLVFKFGYQPAPVRIMKPSYFSNASEIGAVVYRRFYSPIEEQKLVVMGVPPQPAWHREIVRGFLETAAGEKRPFELVIAETQMPALDLAGLPPMELIQIPMNTQTQAELIDAIREARAAGKKTLIYTASVFSTHLLPGNPILRYEQATGDRLFSITTGPLALQAVQEHVVTPSCVGSERDGTGMAPLGCTILQAGRYYYRKNIPQDRFVAVMNSPKPDKYYDNDYLLLVSYPNQDKGAAAVDRNPRRPVIPSGAIAPKEQVSVEAER